MKGYKAFDENLCCQGFQYEIGKTYEMDEDEIKICEKGFHFCKTIRDCYIFYPANGKTRICEVEAIGKVLESENKCCTNKIKIVSEITDEDVKKCNTGKMNTGYFNTGYYNIGNSNTGNSNTGNFNTGNFNAGDFNAGNSNAGYYNTGYFNTGYYNIGNSNTGYYNIGGFNAGDCNSGNHNSGNWNAGDFNTGCFCTEEAELILFDKPSGMTRDEFYGSRACEILVECPFGVHRNKDGTLIEYTPADRRKWWDELDENNKQIIMDLPNFDMDKFKKCMQME